MRRIGNIFILSMLLSLCLVLCSCSNDEDPGNSTASQAAEQTVSTGVSETIPQTSLVTEPESIATEAVTDLAATYFNETYWRYSKGPTNGTNYVALFHKDGTFSYIRPTDYSLRDGTYSFHDDVLTVQGLDYTWVTDHFESIEPVEIFESAEPWTFSLTPDPEERYDWYIGDAVYAETVPTVPSNWLTDKLRSGVWILYSSQSPSCIEITFFDRGTCAGRTLDLSGEFIQWNTNYCGNYTADPDTGTVLFENEEHTNAFIYDADLDCMLIYYDDGPSGATRILRVKFYESTPTADALFADSREYLDYWNGSESYAD